MALRASVGVSSYGTMRGLWSHVTSSFPLRRAFASSMSSLPWRSARGGPACQRHGSSRPGVDDSAASRVPSLRSSLPIPDPRPRQHLFRRSGRSSKRIWSPDAEDARPRAAGERLLRNLPIGTCSGRECLDFLIPINERHLKTILNQCVVHYNRGRPHSALGPGIPEPPQAKIPASAHRHKLPVGHRVVSKAILGGLHHEYGLGKEAA